MEMGGCGGVAVWQFLDMGQIDKTGFFFSFSCFSHFLACGIGNSHNFFLEGGGQCFVFCENMHTSWYQISCFCCLDLLTFLQIFVGVVMELEKSDASAAVSPVAAGLFLSGWYLCNSCR